VRILEYPTMLHAKAFVRDREEVLAGTCNLEAWSPRRFFEIDVRVRPTALAAQFDERCWRYVARDSDLAEALLDGLARPV
jgi:phosphatidylserine/phosphatidylglycerophosphate/cardiolipin synthase-like enzyme